MSYRTFNRKTEYGAFKMFMQKLRQNTKIKYVSKISCMDLVPKTYIGVYIDDSDYERIHVAIRRRPIKATV